ncbi:MAG TPA: lysylphosphatidylglycerol synthase domain-containing protein, partial [Candidatus Omnitrophota bacterium]|nr:lysylphosphatidylglycerol synthase domain-containing protein [Candidatus Omnitrophota bacterium]
LDRLMGYCALVTVMLAACAIGWQYVQDPAVLASVAIIAFALILVLFSIFNGRAYGFVNRRLSCLNAGRISTVFKEAHEQLRVLGSQRTAVFAALGVSILLQMISPVTSYLIGLSLGIRLDIRYFFIYMPIIGTITMLPVSIAGLGVREDATVRFFSKAGVGHDAALAMSLTGFFISVLFAAAGGLYYVFTLHRRRV